MGRRLSVLAAVWVTAVLTGAGQAPAPPPAPGAPQLSDQVFKNIQVLKGIPVDEFMDTMGMFAAALGYDCVSCHGPAISTDRAAFAETTPAIQRARQMILMMNGINRTNFGGEPRVSCFTCHRGQIRPEVVPDLALQYGELVENPNAMTVIPSRTNTPEKVFARYLQALGGAERVATLTSLVATGTYTGFNTGGNPMPIEIRAQAPDRRARIVRMPSGVEITTYDGREGWAAEEWRPVPLLALTNSNLAGARADAVVTFPAGLRQAYASWVVSSTILDEQPVDILQGTQPGQLPVNFYFDQQGLLVRQVRWNRTAVGTVPTQIDYTDYRAVDGVQIPFKTVVTWTNGQNTIEYKDVRLNVPIDPSSFARPAPFQRTP